MTATTSREFASRLAALFGWMTEVCWLAVVGLVPLFTIPSMYHSFYPPKALLIQFLALVMLATVVARWLLSGKSDSASGIVSFVRDPMYAAALAFAVIVTLSTVFSISPWISIVGSINRKQGLLTILALLVVFFVASTNLRNRTQLVRIVTVMLISSGLVSIIGIVEHHSLPFAQGLLSTRHWPRVGSTTGNPLQLSGYLAMVIPFTLAAVVALRHCRVSVRRPYVALSALTVLLIMQLWCLILSIYSYVLLLYLVPALLFVALYVLLRIRRQLLTAAALSLLALVVAAGAMMAIPQWRNAVSGTPPYSLGEMPERDTEERLHATLYGRARYWVYALDVLPQSMSNPQHGDRTPMLRPWIGYGPETYYLTTQRHIPPEFLSTNTDQGYARDRPHNHFLYLTLTMGLLGIGGWLVLLACAGIRVSRTIRQTEFSSIRTVAGVAITCAVIGYLLHGMFTPLSTAVDSLFWSSLALIPVLQALVERDYCDRRRTDAAPVGPRYSWSRTLIVGILLVGAIGAAFLAVVNPIQANIALRNASSMAATGHPDAVFMYSHATELQPREPFYWHSLGMYAYSVALNAPTSAKPTIIELSMIALEEARDREPLYAYRYQRLGDLQLYANASTGMMPIDAAVTSYQGSIELSPGNAVLYGRLAVAHMVDGNLHSARICLERAEEYDYRWAPTKHLGYALKCLEGNGDVATQSLVSRISEDPVELRRFAHVVTIQLRMYDLATPIAEEMLPWLDAADEDYAQLAIRGVLLALTNEPEMAAQALTAAMKSAPEDAAQEILRTVNYVSDYVFGLREALIGVS